MDKNCEKRYYQDIFVGYRYYNLSFFDYICTYKSTSQNFQYKCLTQFKTLNTN